MINHFVRIKTHLFFWMLSGSFYLQKSNSGLCYGSKMLMNEIICCIDVELRYTLLGCIIHVYMFVRCKGIILCLLYHFHDVFCVQKMRTVWICYIYRIYQRPWAKKIVKISDDFDVILILVSSFQNKMNSKTSVNRSQLPPPSRRRPPTRIATPMLQRQSHSDADSNILR